MNTKTVLVVEDEPSISKLCERVLTAEGFEVDIAVNGRIAQDIIRDLADKKQYELCIVDIRTPEMNGMELYAWMKDENPQLAGRVIFTTGSVIQEDINDFMEQSGRPYLPKPFTPAELRNVVRDAIKDAE